VGHVTAEPTVKFVVTRRHEGGKETLIDFVKEKGRELGLGKFLLVAPLILIFVPVFIICWVV